MSRRHHAAPIPRPPPNCLQGISFAGPAVCMIALAFLTPTTPGTGPAALIVGIMSLAFALGAWARAGLYCNHQDLSPKYAAALLGECNFYPFHPFHPFLFHSDGSVLRVSVVGPLGGGVALAAPVATAAAHRGGI